MDGLKIVGEGITISEHRREDINCYSLSKISEYVNPDFVHVFIDGNIVETGAKDLSNKLEKRVTSHTYEKF